MTGSRNALPKVNIAGGQVISPGQSTASVDLMALTPQEFDLFMAGYLSGVSAGIDMGREQADNEAAAIHRAAHRVVQAMAKIPTHEELERLRRTYPEAAA